MKKFFSITTSLLTVTAFMVGVISCEKDNPTSTNKPKPEDSTITDDPVSGKLAGVYVAGYVMNGNDEYIATLWKDGKAQALSTSESEAYSVFVSGNDVYIVGYENEYAILWKNGIAQKLSTSESYANYVYVFGNDVYVAGGVINANNKYVATLWKNGIAQTLSTSESSANSVYVSGNDVYVAGETGTLISTGGAPIDARRVSLWKNGKEQTFSSLPSSANSIFVSGNDVYMAGHIGKNNGDGESDWSATLWKNGIEQTLSASASGAYSVYVAENNVYVAGINVEGYVTLWKNGNVQKLSRLYGEAYSVYVSGNDVYVAGYVEDENDNYVAKLWKNGIETNLSGGTTSDATAYSVFVKK